MERKYNIGTFIDKTNKKYNMLTARKYKGNGIWLCDCDCGKKNVEVRSVLLNEVEGRRKQLSCGCLRNKNTPEDENYFSCINTSEKAYILGFIASDGCISKKFNKIKIDLSKIDEDILTKIQKEIKHNNIIYHYQQDNIKFKGSDKVYHSETSRLVISSKKMVDDLEEIGVVQNKTYILNIKLEKIPKEFFFDFFRGMIDGDGCISFSFDKRYFDLSLTTSNIMADKIINWLNSNYELKSHFTKVVRHKNNPKTVTLINTNLNYIVNILNKIYENSRIYLDRKYNKYKELIDSYNSNDYPDREYR